MWLNLLPTLIKHIKNLGGKQPKLLSKCVLTLAGLFSKDIKLKMINSIEIIMYVYDQYISKILIITFI